MSLFQFKVSSLNKFKNETKNDNLFRSKIDQNILNVKVDSNILEKKQEEKNSNMSQFIIDEPDLWNDDSSDIFEMPKKGNKDIKYDEKLLSSMKVENPKNDVIHNGKVEDEYKENLHVSIDDYENNSVTIHSKLNSISPQQESNFDLDFEPYFSPGFENNDLIIERSPTLHDSEKISSYKNDNTSGDFKLETSELSETPKKHSNLSVLSTISDSKQKSLGLGRETELWLQRMLESEEFRNISVEVSDQKLVSNLSFLNQLYVEVLEKMSYAFEVLPIDLLKDLPDFCPDVFISLRTTKRRIKALQIKTENIIKRRNIQESVLKHQSSIEAFNEFNKSFVSSAQTNRSSFGCVNSSASELNNTSDIGLNNSVENLLPHYQASTSTLCTSARSNTLDPTPQAGIIDYTEMLYKSPRRISECTTPSKENPHANMKNDSVTGEFDGFHFPHSNNLLKQFKQKFGLKSFRPNQLQVINAALLGHDCFVLMPTGGGKSLCYQLPAVVSRGVTVVVSPLRSLILDQVTKLLTLDISACHLSGDIKESEVSAVFRRLNMPEPDIKLLYVTPEKVGASNTLRNCFQGLYKRNMLARFVIDEAHCVSQWGHDFRPDYKKLRELRENFPNVNIMALTATATPRVRIDILHQLLMTNPKWFLSSFNRTNLTYEVKEKKGKSSLKEIASLIQNDFPKDTGIVYCFSRKECEDVAKDLKNCGITAIPYHAGLDDNERARVQNMWMNGKVKVVCATIAFGMGIDKLDVRFVIHYTLPKSIEGYYQESGRAGRDGEKSNCILYYCYRDKHRILKLINMDQSMETRAARKIHIDNLFRVVAFAENKTDCRRALQLEYFGEKFNRKECLENKSTACDNCLQQGMYETLDVTAESKAIVAAVKQVCGSGNLRQGNFTMLHFVEIFKGTGMKKVESEGHDKLPLCGMGKSWQRLDAERLFRKLIMEEYLTERILVKEEGLTCVYLKIGRRGEDLLQGKVTIMFDVKKSKKNSGSNKSDKIISEKQVNPAVLEIQEKCYAELTDVIRGIASSLNCNPNAIMNVQALRMMSSSLPQTAEEMLTVNHVTTANFEKYGAMLLEITKKYAQDKEALAVTLPEINEEDFFVDDPWTDGKQLDNSPYFETDITYCGKEGKGNGRKRKNSNFKRWQYNKKWKGTSNAGKGTSKPRAGGKNSVKVAKDGSGVTTISSSTFSTLMELPTDKSRGFTRPKVLLKNL